LHCVGTSTDSGNVCACDLGAHLSEFQPSTYDTPRRETMNSIDESTLSELISQVQSDPSSKLLWRSLRSYLLRVYYDDHQDGLLRQSALPIVYDCDAELCAIQADVRRLMLREVGCALSPCADRCTSIDTESTGALNSSRSNTFRNGVEAQLSLMRSFGCVQAVDLDDGDSPGTAVFRADSGFDAQLGSPRKAESVERETQTNDPTGRSHFESSCADHLGDPSLAREILRMTKSDSCRRLLKDPVYACMATQLLAAEDHARRVLGEVVTPASEVVTPKSLRRHLHPPSGAHPMSHFHHHIHEMLHRKQQVEGETRVPGVRQAKDPGAAPTQCYRQAHEIPSRPSADHRTDISPFSPPKMQRLRHAAPPMPTLQALADSEALRTRTRNDTFRRQTTV
jgi:hypothetical protein